MRNGRAATGIFDDLGSLADGLTEGLGRAGEYESVVSAGEEIGTLVGPDGTVRTVLVLPDSLRLDYAVAEAFPDGRLSVSRHATRAAALRSVTG